MAFRSTTDDSCPDTHPVRIPQLFVEVNYQIEKFANDKTTKSTDFILSTGDRKGWTAHVDYISGWQQELLSSALYTCFNTDQNNPNCSFHQFSSVEPAARRSANAAGEPAPRRLYKASPAEEVDGLDHLLVMGAEARRSGMPEASCTFGASEFQKPPMLANTRGTLNTTDCAPSPAPSPIPPSPAPPVPSGSCGTVHRDMDLNGSNGPGRPAQNANDCCKMCLAEATTSCNGYTFWAGFCYLKQGATKFVRNNGRTSAFVNSTSRAKVIF